MGRRKTGKRQFLMIPRNVKRSAAYHSLNSYARAFLWYPELPAFLDRRKPKEAKL